MMKILTFQTFHANALKGKFDNNKILKYCLNLFGENFKKAIISIAEVWLVVIINKYFLEVNFRESGNESTGKIAFYVEYILVVLILIKNFLKLLVCVIKLYKMQTAFSNSLIPLLATLP